MSEHNTTHGYLADIDAIPAELKALPQWCVFSLTPQGSGKYKKVPLVAGERDRKAEVDDPRTWRSYEVALRDARVRGTALGFAFTRESGYFFIDVDDALDETGETERDDVQYLVDTLDTYTEVSVSGNGLHIIGRGSFDPNAAPPPASNGHAPLELYPKRGNRWCVLTGRTLIGSEEIRDRQETLTTLFPPRPRGERPSGTARQGLLTEAEGNAIIGWARGFWTDGRRNYMALHLSGTLANAGVAREQGVRIIEQCATGDNDPGAKVNTAHHTYDQYEAGQPVSGWQGLREVVGLTSEEIAPLDQILAVYKQRFSDHVPDHEHDNPGVGSRGHKAEWTHPRVLIFRGTDEIGEHDALTPKMIAPYHFQGAITEIDGAVKRAGKTTFMTALCRAVLDGLPFLGTPTVQSPVVYLSEQPLSSFAEALRRAGLMDRSDFRYLLLGEAMGASWVEIIKRAREEVRRVGAGLLVVDTLSQWAKLRGDAENSAGAAMEAMAPLQEAAAQDAVCVSAIRHDKGRGGEIAESARGSTAFAGVVDVIARIRRTDDPTETTRRYVEALGRFSGIPDIVTVELTDEGYQLTTGDDVVGGQEARFRLAHYLPRMPIDAVTEEDLIKESGIARSTVRRVLDEYRGYGFLRELGTGNRHDPMRYWWPRQVDQA